MLYKEILNHLIKKSSQVQIALMFLLCHSLLNKYIDICFHNLLEISRKDKKRPCILSDDYSSKTKTNLV